MPTDPLATACPQCDAGPGTPCDTAVGLHWVRAEAAGMSPIQMLRWSRDGRHPTPSIDFGRPEGAPARFGRRDDLAIALVALLTACDLAEQHRAPSTEIARLRDLARQLASNDARRAS